MVMRQRPQIKVHSRNGQQRFSKFNALFSLTEQNLMGLWFLFFKCLFFFFFPHRCWICQLNCELFLLLLEEVRCQQKRECWRELHAKFISSNGYTGSVCLLLRQQK